MSEKPKESPPLHEIINVIPNPFMVIDKQYRIVAANQIYCQHYRVKPEAVIGRFCYEISHRASSPCHLNGEHCPMHDVFKNQRQTHVVHVHYDPQGQEERVQLTAQPIRNAAGEVTYMGESIVPLDRPKLDRSILIGRSRAMLDLIAILECIAPTTTTVLLEGESGVGKECAAQYIHQISRPDAPFVVIDCGSLSPTLIESELFGHEKGAFTGAITRKHGLIEQARRGTLFIDEISELPLQLQTKLLRLLESGTYRPIGASRYQSADTRIIAATNRPLGELSNQGEFRGDLYYRLSAFPIRVPPLREHKDDIPDLAHAFLKRRAGGYLHLPLDPAVLERLLQHDYPGNVRELRNILDRAVILAAGRPLNTSHLQFDPNGYPLADCGQNQSTAVPVRSPAKLDPLSLDQVIQALEINRGNRRKTAQQLQISERTLYRHIAKYRAQSSE